ncbi:MAG: hypothetical protein EXS43_12055 [Opitutus sp.]|nr:hypothetical protein [Opitutus sp.]
MRVFSSLGFVSGFSWAWRALRGHSVTFAALFACGLFGLSIMTSIRRLLNRVDAPWYVWLFVPILAVGYLAKKEAKWIPDVEHRKKWAQRIFFGSIALTLLIAFFRSDQPR